MKLFANILVIGLGAFTFLTAAAEPAKPALPDPDYCARRDADPEKCVIHDGPPHRHVVRAKRVRR